MKNLKSDLGCSYCTSWSTVTFGILNMLSYLIRISFFTVDINNSVLRQSHDYVFAYALKIIYKLIIKYKLRMLYFFTYYPMYLFKLDSNFNMYKFFIKYYCLINIV